MRARYCIHIANAKKKREKKREREREVTRISFKMAHCLASKGRCTFKCILSSSLFRHPQPRGIALFVNECTITKQRQEWHEYGPVRA